MNVIAQRDFELVSNIEKRMKSINQEGSLQVILDYDRQLFMNEL